MVRPTPCEWPKRSDSKCGRSTRAGRPIGTESRISQLMPGLRRHSRVPAEKSLADLLAALARVLPKCCERPGRRVSQARPAQEPRWNPPARDQSRGFDRHEGSRRAPKGRRRHPRDPEGSSREARPCAHPPRAASSRGGSRSGRSETRLRGRAVCRAAESKQRPKP